MRASVPAPVQFHFPNPGFEVLDDFWPSSMGLRLPGIMTKFVGSPNEFAIEVLRVQLILAKFHDGYSPAEVK